jgi:vacuolar-type H+-ATPase subunit H
MTAPYGEAHASMKEVVNTILRAEEEAKSRIAQAREEAKKITADADVEARRLAEAERETAHAQARELVEKAIAETKAKRAARLEEITGQVDDLKGAKADAVRRAVQKAYERIVHVERA